MPTLRKHGGYLTPQKLEEALLDPDTIIRLATNLKEERRAKERLALALEEKTQQLDEAEMWLTVKRYAKEQKINWRSVNWRKLKATPYELGFEIHKIFDANYTEVNLYHRHVFDMYELW